MSLALSINFIYLIILLIVLLSYCIVIFKQFSTIQKNGGTYEDIKNGIHNFHFNVGVCT